MLRLEDSAPRPQLSTWNHFLCPFMSRRACAAHLCHQPFVHLHAYLPSRPGPARPPLPQPPTSASSSLGPYLLLSAGRQLLVGSTVLIRFVSGDLGHRRPLSASGAEAAASRHHIHPFQGGPTPPRAVPVMLIG